jgi:hypothetical protein
VLRRGHQQQPQTEELTSVLQPTGQQPGQSVQACNVKKSNLDTMFKVASVVQQIMTELNGAVSEETKIVITKIVLSLIK